MSYTEGEGFHHDMSDFGANPSETGIFNDPEVLSPEQIQGLNEEGIIVVDVANPQRGLWGSAKEFTQSAWDTVKNKATLVALPVALVGSTVGNRASRIALPVALAGAFIAGACAPETYDDDEPETATPTNTATATATFTPHIEKTPPPTPTNTPEAPDGSSGNISSVEQLSIPEAQKEAINKMLENATPQIIVEMNGKTVILAIDNEMLKSAENGQRLCPVVVGSEATEPCPILTSIEVNTKFEDANQRIVEGVEEAKFQAWAKKSGDSSLTFEDYMAQQSQRDFAFPIRAQDIFSGETANVSVNEDSPYVLIVRNDPNDPRFEQGHSIMDSSEMTLSHFTGNNVIGQEVYFKKDFGVGGVIIRGTNVNTEELAFAEMWGGALTHLSNKTDLNVVGDGRSTQTEPLPEVWQAIVPHLYKMTEDGQYDISDNYPTVFITSGIDVGH